MGLFPVSFQAAISISPGRFSLKTSILTRMQPSKALRIDILYEGVYVHGKALFNLNSMCMYAKVGQELHRIYRSVMYGYERIYNCVQIQGVGVCNRTLPCAIPMILISNTAGLFFFYANDSNHITAHFFICRVEKKRTF